MIKLTEQQIELGYKTRREVYAFNSVVELRALSNMEHFLGNEALANEYRTIASAIETRYQTLKNLEKH
jgi:hypothetical protein